MYPKKTLHEVFFFALNIFLILLDWFLSQWHHPCSLVWWLSNIFLSIFQITPWCSLYREYNYCFIRPHVLHSRSTRCSVCTFSALHYLGTFSDIPPEVLGANPSTYSLLPCPHYQTCGKCEKVVSHRSLTSHHCSAPLPDGPSHTNQLRLLELHKTERSSPIYQARVEFDLNINVFDLFKRLF